MEKLTSRELAERTIRDLELRKKRREKGIKDAEEYGYEMRYKAYKRKSKIRLRKYGGR